MASLFLFCNIGKSPIIDLTHPNDSNRIHPPQCSLGWAAHPSFPLLSAFAAWCCVFLSLFCCTASLRLSLAPRRRRRSLARCVAVSDLCHLRSTHPPSSFLSSAPPNPSVHSTFTYPSIPSTPFNSHLSPFSAILSNLSERSIDSREKNRKRFTDYHSSTTSIIFPNPGAGASILKEKKNKKNNSPCCG